MEHGCPGIEKLLYVFTVRFVIHVGTTKFPKFYRFIIKTGTGEIPIRITLRYFVRHATWKNTIDVGMVFIVRGHCMGQT
jgi:hypothetical protein